MSAPRTALAALAVTLAVAGCGGAPKLEAGPPPTTPAVTAAPSPSPTLVNRRQACRDATTLTGEAAELLTQFATDYTTLPVSEVERTLGAMRDVQGQLPLHVAEAYEPLVAPVAQVREALTYGGSLTVDGDAYRADVLNFMTSCSGWAGQ